MGGYVADKFGAKVVLTVLFVGIILLSSLMAYFIYDYLFFSICCLSMALFLGAGNGAVFKLVPSVSPNNTGAVTGIISAVGGIGGFFPPLVMGLLKGITGSYSSGFILLAFFALACLLVHTFLYQNRGSATHISIVKNLEQGKS